MLSEDIRAIPNSRDLMNVLLSKTQRKTPTVVHPGYKITRIRSFYMRKVKFFQDALQEKLDAILNNFPKVDDVHPFFGDLINVLYDRDHYKLALGHIKSTKSMTQNITRDYLKLLKYSDSLYRCKMLKKACLGRVCTTIRKINSSLAYLQEVRKHMMRLPAINPYQRTILLTGYPNVGKSSLINHLTKANVDVQPYPFTTKSLYVGHFEFNNVRWQMIDSPGLLDHPLEEMNTIEMQSVTALAHLKACVLFLFDLSQQCGYSVQKQLHLFKSLCPLYKSKPVILIFSKSDLKKVSQLPQQQKAQIQAIIKQNSFPYLQLSNITAEGVKEIQQLACKLLADFRLKHNIDKVVGNDKILKLSQSFMRGLYVAQPKKRDEKDRPTSIPQSVRSTMQSQRPSFKSMEQQNGGAGVFYFPLQEHYILKEQDWKYDAVPQIMNGKNIADFVDPDIMARLQQLQAEEERMLAQLPQDCMEYEGNLDEEQQEALVQLRQDRDRLKSQHHLNRHRTISERRIKAQRLKQLVDDTQGFRKRNRSRSKVSIKNTNEDSMDEEDQDPHHKIHKEIRSKTRSRSTGYHRPISSIQKKVKKQMDKQTYNWRKSMKVNESDRHIPTKLPKHLNSGKTSLGSRSRR